MIDNIEKHLIYLAISLLIIAYRFEIDILAGISAGIFLGLSMPKLNYFKKYK
jgi:hypothetical protein